MSEIPQTEAVINRLKLLEASKNLDEKMTSLSQEVARLRKKIEEEYEYKDNEEEKSLDEELDGFPKGNFLIGSRVNYEIYTLFMEIVEKKDLKIQRAMNEAMLLYIKKYQE
jgi:predicted transcriptional regulator